MDTHLIEKVDRQGQVLPCSNLSRRAVDSEVRHGHHIADCFVPNTIANLESKIE